MSDLSDVSQKRQIQVSLRPVVLEDLPIFFEQQLDREAIYSAAFTRDDPTDRSAFESHWKRILAQPSVTAMTILVDAEVAGHIACFGPADQRELTYWLGGRFWNRGVATQAVAQFLPHVRVGRLYARVAEVNQASLRVLEKNGFVVDRVERDFANGRGVEVEEKVMRLDELAE